MERNIICVHSVTTVQVWRNWKRKGKTLKFFLYVVTTMDVSKSSATNQKNENKAPTEQKSIQRQNVSFTFSKRISKQLPGNKLKEDDSLSDREMILSVEGKEIKGVLPKEEKKKLVIHHASKNSSKFQQKKDEKASGSTLEEMAIKEVLKDSAEQNEKWENREFSNYTVTIPAILQNRNILGNNNDQIPDFESYPEPATSKDLEDVPVEEFASAYIRGFGCEVGDPIGLRNQKFVPAVEAKIRSKGMGLGADKTAKEKAKLSNSKQTEQEEELPLVKGSYVRVTHGNHAGHYGQVEGLDEMRAVVKLSQEDKPVSLLIAHVEVVSKKEFKKESKIINRSAYEDYQNSHKSMSSSDVQRTSNKESNKNDVAKEKDVKESREGNSDHSYKKSSSAEDSSKKSHKRRSRSPDHGSKHSSSEDKRSRTETWVCPQLRVRFVDKQYKKGKYFNQKMVVDDVMSINSCVCITADRKYLEDINPKSLETVVPRSESSFIKVVLGKYKGQIGTILKRDKANCIATINFLSDREKVTKVDYDSICEYVGDVSQFE